MEIDKPQNNAKHLEESIDRLTDDNKSYFLGVLEGLTFAQNVKETLVGEIGETQHKKPL